MNRVVAMGENNQRGFVKKQILRLLDPYYLLLFIGFFYNTTIFYALWILDKVPYGDLVSPFVTPVLILVAVAMYCTQNSLHSVLNRKTLLFVLLTVAALAVSMLVHPETQEVVTERYVGRLFITCIPYFALGLIFRGDEESFDFLGFWSKVAVLVGVAYLYYLLNFGNPEALNDDNMGLAYNYFYVVSLVVLDSFRKPSWTGVLCSVVGAVMVVSLGTRGPVLLLVVLVAACCLYRVLYRRPLRVVGVAIVVFLLVLFTGFFEAILQWLLEQVDAMGLSTRVLEQLLEEGSFESEERTKIVEILGEKILQRPFFGYGVAGEWQFVGWNAHNMYYTFWSNFGIIFGTAGIVAMVYLALRSFFLCYHDCKRLLFVMMLICWIFPKGFFGGEPLSMEVFLFLGVSLRMIFEQKKREKELPSGQRRRP